MTNGLAMASMVEFTYSLLNERGVLEDTTKVIFKMFDGGVSAYESRKGGKAGYFNFGWNQLAVDGKLFHSERLNCEIGSKLRGYACVFNDKCGNKKSLAEDTIPLVEHDSSISFEPSMLYMCDRWHIEWKIRQLKYVINGEIGNFRKVVKI